MEIKSDRLSTAADKWQSADPGQSPASRGKNGPRNDDSPSHAQSSSPMDYLDGLERREDPDSGSTSGVPGSAPGEVPKYNENDMSRNWAMLVGQGPTQVERVAKRDALAREAITDALVGLLRNRFTTAPLAIGLFGAWGSGKSSQINFLRDRLKVAAPGKPAIRIVEFNAWEHEKCDNLSAALAQTVVEHLVRGTSLSGQWTLARQLAARKRAHITEAAGKDWSALSAKLYRWVAPFISFELAAALVIVLLVLLTNMPGLAKSFASVTVLALGAWKALNKYITANLTNWFKRIASGAGGGPFGLPDFAEKLGSFHEIRQTLAHLVSLRIEGGENASTGEYLLIVVDDLDRCSVGTIKLVLDAVRLVTNMPRVVTMVAVDDRIAFPAVESFFEQFKGSGRYASAVARDYLAKVFNVSISLPPVSAALATRFIAERLFADVHRNAVRGEADDEEGDGPGTSVQRETRTIPDGTALVTRVEVEAFTRLAIAIGMTNPRALWRMKQAWYLLRNMVLSLGEDEASFDPWMRSMLVREAILTLPAASRCEIDNWARAVKEGASDIEVPATIAPGLAALLRADIGGIAERWAYVDIVLLPAAACA